MTSPEATAKQSLKEARLPVVRKNGTKGPVNVPWYVERVSTGSGQSRVPRRHRSETYEQLEGTVSRKQDSKQNYDSDKLLSCYLRKNASKNSLKIVF